MSPFPSRRPTLAWLLSSALVTISCGSSNPGSTSGAGGNGGTGPGGGTAGTTGGGASGGGASGGGTTGGGGSASSGAGGTGGSAVAGTGGVTGGGGSTGAGTGGRGGGAGGSSAAGAGGSSAAGAGGSSAAGTGGGSAGRGGTTGAAGRGGTTGGAGTTGMAGRGGTTGGAGTTGAGGTGGATSCAGRAISLSANGTASAADTAQARVEADLGTELPIGNAQRTVEFWAFIKTTDWVGEKNEVYFYGGSGSAASFGLDFGTNPVTGMANNHATLNPFTGGGFNDDSVNDLGINSSTDQWVHIAMTWNGTVVVTYVNGLAKITTQGTGGVTALATTQSVLTIGCNPSNMNCFNGMFDELRIWNVARSASQIQGSYNKPLVGNEAGLVGYWKFDEAPGATTTADAVTTTGHTAHAGTLKADSTTHNPTFVTPTVPVPLVCP